jgi:hypothetical protein
MVRQFNIWMAQLATVPDVQALSNVKKRSGAVRAAKLLVLFFLASAYWPI